MCSHLTGVCLDRADFNLKRAPGMLAHEVPSHPIIGPREPVQNCDFARMKEREKWTQQFTPPPLGSPSVQPLLS
jgi:hypothetical protein